jgi:hypothetical protein
MAEPCALQFDDCGPAVYPFTGHRHERSEPCPEEGCETMRVCVRCAEAAVRIGRAHGVQVLDRRDHRESHG